jgi:hypothetical protein
MWLHKNDPWRKRGELFNGKDELDLPPHKISGGEIKTLLKTWKECPTSGKVKKRKRAEKKRKRGEKKIKEAKLLMGVWKRRSVFFGLRYWKVLGTPHCLDVMHITKNVCESLLGTILDMPDKTKDGPKARKDLIKLGIRDELQGGRPAKKLRRTLITAPRLASL